MRVRFSAVIARLVVFVTLVQLVEMCKLQPRRFSKVCTTILCTASALMIDLNSYVALADDAAATKPVPQLYGLKKDRLLPCKSKSNCISSSSISSLDHYGKPWAFESKDGDAEYQQLVGVLESITDFPLNVVDKDATKRYVRVETRSAVPLMGTDDIEFLVNSLDNIITYRSNSREVIMAGPENIGDGGSNRNRLEVIRRKLGVEEMALAATYDEKDLYQEQDKLGLFGRMNAASMPNEINFLDNTVPSTTSSE
jgi:uncharacterized protein (DUF1499 family)